MIISIILIIIISITTISIIISISNVITSLIMTYICMMAIYDTICDLCN